MGKERVVKASNALIGSVSSWLLNHEHFSIGGFEATQQEPSVNSIEAERINGAGLVQC
jgi:hypothetical protein